MRLICKKRKSVKQYKGISFKFIGLHGVDRTKEYRWVSLSYGWNVFVWY